MLLLLNPRPNKTKIKAARNQYKQYQRNIENKEPNKTKMLIAVACFNPRKSQTS